MTGKANVSCFFLDTRTREDARTHTASNRIKFWLKACLLLVSLWVHHAAMAVAMPSPAPPSETWSLRRRLSMVCAVLFVARVLVQMFVFWRRAIGWPEVWAEAGVIIPVSLLSLAQLHADNSGGGGATGAWLGFAVFLAGSFINIWPEWQRHVWKRDSRNAGRLYTGSLFCWCRRVNYTGEILLMVGWACVSGKWHNLWVGATMGFGMAFWSTPEIEFYLNKRYGDEWKAYQAEVRWRLVPGVW